MTVLRGGCFCGALRYETRGEPRHETSCHCSICRRTSGAPFVTWFTVAPETFRWVQGRPKQLQSSLHGTRAFCGDCGTPVTFRSSRSPDELDVTVCSLDEPERVPPKDHTRTRTKLAWLRLEDDLPAFPEARDPS